MSESFIPMLSSRSCMVSGFPFKFLIHFELMFVSTVRYRSYFILLHVHFCHGAFIEETVFFTENS